MYLSHQHVSITSCFYYNKDSAILLCIVHFELYGDVAGAEISQPRSCNVHAMPCQLISSHKLVGDKTCFIF